MSEPVRKRKTAEAAGPGPSTSKKARLPVDDKELEQVKKLQTIISNQPTEKATLAALNIDNIIAVEEMDDGVVQRIIQRIMLDAAHSIIAGQGFYFDVPSRSSSNQLYVPELERIVLRAATKQRAFANTSTVRKISITTRVLELIHEVVKRGIHITKRDLFYTDVKLFSKQLESDAVLDDVATMIGCTRTSLNVVASDKGVVIGRVKFLEDGDFIDCTRMGVGGKAIPSLINKITQVEGDAQFVLLVEKDAAFMRLAEDRFYNQYPCIIITGKGQPDVATRQFLKLIREELKIPVLGLMDSDPFGLKILSVYMSSSQNMSYDSASLATGDIKWLGVRPSDLNKYKVRVISVLSEISTLTILFTGQIPKECRLEMSAEDIKMGKKLLEDECIKSNPKWVKEIEIMLETREKAEIQALSTFGFQYLTQEYLPKKIRAGDWI